MSIPEKMLMEKYGEKGSWSLIWVVLGADAVNLRLENIDGV